MDDNVIAVINKQAKEEDEGIQFGDINKKTTVNDYHECGDDFESSSLQLRVAHRGETGLYWK